MTTIFMSNLLVCRSRVGAEYVPAVDLCHPSDLGRKLLALERRYDRQFEVVFDAIRQIMSPDVPPKRRRIAFRPDES
jgi:hypothetical protein